MSDEGTRIRRVEEDLKDHKDRSLAEDSKIHERLNKINDGLTRIETTLSEVVVSRMKVHEVTLYGNGRPGLDTQVDRLNQFSTAVKWVVGILTTGVLGLVVKSFWDIVIKGT